MSAPEAAPSKPQSFIFRILGLILILIGILMFVEIMFLRDFTVPEHASSADKFQALWRKDLEYIQKQKPLNKLFSEVHRIRLVPTHTQVNQWIAEMRSTDTQATVPLTGIPIELNEGGTVDLEILFNYWKDSKGEAVVVQYSFIEKGTNELLLELGRTLFLVGQREDYDDNPGETEAM
ncbi:MAG: hypothetical protein CL675_13285 [Bdellovibrionaceae bacterium]|nr:hypothetical protein [Pseudobdellovibrionaceae bacterium]